MQYTVTHVGADIVNLLVELEGALRKATRVPEFVGRGMFYKKTCERFST